MKTMSSVLILAITKSIIRDMNKVFLLFKEEEPRTFGVRLELVTTEGLGQYLTQNKSMIPDFITSLTEELKFDFEVHFKNEGVSEYVPLY